MYGILILAVLLGIMSVLREFICWYWKINEKIVLLESIDKKLEMLVNGQNVEDLLQDKGLEQRELD